jgi:hypothetical protein
MKKILSSVLAIALISTAIVETAIAKPFGSSSSFSVSKPSFSKPSTSTSSSSSSTSKINLTKSPEPSAVTAPSKINLTKSADPVAAPASSKINPTKPTTESVTGKSIAPVSPPIVQTRPVVNNYNTYNQPTRVETRNGSILPALAVGAVAGAVATNAFASDHPSNVQTQHVVQDKVVTKSSPAYTGIATSKTPYLTICNSEEFAKAQEWQVACKSSKDVQSNMCPILSYFRYCKPANVDEVQGLKPAKSNYQNVFLKD